MGAEVDDSGGAQPLRGPYGAPDRVESADEVAGLRAQLRDAPNEMQQATDQLRERSATFRAEVEAERVRLREARMRAEGEYADRAREGEAGEARQELQRRVDHEETTWRPVLSGADDHWSARDVRAELTRDARAEIVNIEQTDPNLSQRYRARRSCGETTEPESGVTDQHRPDAGPTTGDASSNAPQVSPVDRTVKQLEWWQLLRGAVPLIAGGIGVDGLYAYFASNFDVPIFWIGVPLGLAGSARAAIGYRGRLREIRSPQASTGRHYPWLFICWALVVAGALIPPYASA